MSWATAWAEVKKAFPDSNFLILSQSYDETILTEGHEIKRTVDRPWFDDGRTGWVEVVVTVNGIDNYEMLPILDFKNKPIPADAITSYDANKAIQRALTKACARHGLGLYVYEGEDLPEEVKLIEELQQKCLDLIKKKCALSEDAKAHVGEICKEIIPEYNGDPREVAEVERLELLKKKLTAVRK